MRAKPRVAHAYDALMATTERVAEARDLFRWALDVRRPPFDAATAADGIARQAGTLAAAAREYAAALRGPREKRRGR